MSDPKRIDIAPLAPRQERWGRSFWEGVVVAGIVIAIAVLDNKFGRSESGDGSHGSKLNAFR